MGLLTWVIVGAIVGWLAGAVLNINNAISGFNFTTFIVAFLGAVIVLYAARLLRFR